MAQEAAAYLERVAARYGQAAALDSARVATLRALPYRSVLNAKSGTLFVHKVCWLWMLGFCESFGGCRVVMWCWVLCARSRRCQFTLAVADVFVREMGGMDDEDGGRKNSAV